MPTRDERSWRKRLRVMWRSTARFSSACPRRTRDSSSRNATSRTKSQAVFNPLMTSHGSGKRGDGREAEQEIAGFPAHLFFASSFGSHHANPSEAFPFLL